MRRSFLEAFPTKCAGVFFRREKRVFDFHRDFFSLLEDDFSPRATGVHFWFCEVFLTIEFRRYNFSSSRPRA